MAERRVASAAVLAACLPAAGCAADPSAAAPTGEPAGAIATLMWVMIAIAAVIYLILLVLLALALLRRRGASDPDARPPHLLRGTRLVVGGGIVLPAVVALVLAGLTLTTMRSGVGADDEAPLRLTVTGHQWWWGVEYEDSGVQTANEIRIPTGRPVEVTLESDNVIHSLWIPALTGKVDLIPGNTNTMTFMAEKPGVYSGKCAEYCGLQHTKMGLVVVATEESEFDDWVANRLQAVRDRESQDLDAGLGIFLGAGCARCHSIGGTVADGEVGPDLTHLGTRSTLGAGTVPNTPGNLAKWIADPASIKSGVKMPPADTKLTPAQMGALVDYLESLE